jgi:16S rRNA C1402 N4-methylase RsmH
MSVFGVGDVLDRCYTPDVLAADVVDTLDLHGDPTVVEPSAGGGAFVRALRARLAGRGSVIAVDVDPGATRFPYVHHVAGSWPSVAAAA